MLNLSKIKKVALIANFNPKQGYPEYAYKTVVKAVKQPIVKPVKYTSTSTGLNRAAIKAAKKAFITAKGLGYKPTVLVKTALS